MQRLPHIVIPSKARNIFLITFVITSFVTPLFAQTDSAATYHSIHYRGSAEIELNEQMFNCQYNFVNVIDSFLYIQLNVGPVEAGRVLLTPDKILYINKLQKNYYEGDYYFFQHLIDLEIDFHTIQDIFNGFPVSVPEDVELSYQGESVFGDFTFFNTLICEYEVFSLKLEVKKVMFNDVPKVSATVPKNFSAITF